MTRRVRFTPLLASGCFWCAATFAQAGQVPFEPRPPISTTQLNALDVLATDLDGDGDPDVISGSLNAQSSTMTAFVNAAGDGSVWIEHSVAMLPFGAVSLAAADIDGDGDQDGVSASNAGGVLVWLENTAGNGTAWMTHAVGTELYNGGFVSAGDVDGDGDQDVLSATGFNNRVLWFENVGGTGTAWVKHTVSSAAALLPRSAALADLDGDGDPDIVSATAGAAGLWFENTAGNGSAWTARTLGLAQGEGETVAADLDGDGDLDVLVPMASANAVGWHENTAGNASTWTLHTIATAVANALSVAAADVDGDGDLDALAPQQNDDTVAWFENVSGNGTLWTRRTIATDAGSPQAVVTADVDGDGDLDALSASFNGGTIAWYRNATIHGNACFVNRTISTAAAGAQSLVASDVDGDGDLDGVSTAFFGDTVAWHENVGGMAAAWTTRTITTAFDQAARAAAGDVDGDGDVDVAAVQGHFAGGALTWFDNTAGNGSAWTTRTVSTVFATAGHVELADLSGDGDLDLLGSGYYTTGVRWFENAAGNGSAWTPGTVPAFGGQTGVVTADLDGDGDLDVASTESFFGDGLGWQENTAGNGSAWAAHTITTIVGATDTLAAADVDGDGDLDLVQPGTNFLVGNTVWYENVGGAGGSWTPHTIFGGEGSVVAAGDLDRDGDVDVVTPGGGNGIRWHENSGIGATWTTRTVSESLGLPGGLGIADLDGDGDSDLLSAFASSDTLGWHENQGGQASLAVVSQAPPTANNSDVVSMLRTTVTHLGRPGEGPLELASLGLRFEESPGDPLTTAEANALIESLRVYRDANGNGVFEPASDVLVTSIGTLSLAGGVQVVPFADGDANVQVTQGAPRDYFVVVELTATASGQVPNQLMATLLQVGPSASVLEDRTFDIPLRLSCPADVSSSIKQAVPVELIGFTVE